MMDTDAYYVNNKTFFVPSDDWYLVGVLNSKSAFDYLRGKCSVLGDESKGRRLEFREQYMEILPIPEAKGASREMVAKLAKEAQRLHQQRRKRVEKFLKDVGLDPAQSSSRNPLEQSWALKPQEFARRVPLASPKLFTAAHDETAALTEKIAKVELEIDERVSALYGL